MNGSKKQTESNAVASEYELSDEELSHVTGGLREVVLPKENASARDGAVFTVKSSP